REDRDQRRSRRSLRAGRVPGGDGVEAWDAREPARGPGRQGQGHGRSPENAVTRGGTSLSIHQVGSEKPGRESNGESLGGLVIEAQAMPGEGASSVGRAPARDRPARAGPLSSRVSGTIAYHPRHGIPEPGGPHP